MPFYYPRSFITLLLAGLILVALPLVAAVITSAIAVDRLAYRSQNTVYQSVLATQSSRRLIEVLTAMERSAHQFVILGDRSVLDAYALSREQFKQIADQFSGLPFDATQRADLDAIIKGEGEIFDLISNRLTPASELGVQVARFSGLSDRAQEIMAKSNQLIDREVEAMRSTADETQRIMKRQAFMLIPVVIFLVVGFAVLISRPIRQLDAAIRELGSGKFTTPVVVTGPEDLQYLGERLEWMRVRLFELEQQKNRFLQQISHELKTPLTALREGAQLLSDEVVGRLSSEQREIVEILRQNGLELQKRIEDLLDYGSIHFHKLRLEFGQVEPRQIVEQVVAGQKLALQAKKIDLRIQLADVALAADREKFRVVLDNLVSNAIKFSPVGGTIMINMQARDNQLAIDVIDQGPGVVQGDAARIFEPFYHGRIAGSGPLKASGLGLSIVKEYVIAHGGSVEVSTVERGRGALFRVQLPLNQGATS